ncbi:MAG: TlpA disulfide reductase family protein [Christiangramia sp.]|nr:TlpA disulfide reductase family protein [Christiangramia sp.]
MKKNFLLTFFLFIEAGFSQNVLPPATLKDLDGNEVSFTQIPTGEPVILALWATWCVPCINELEAIAPLYSEWQELYNVKIYAISIDDARTVNRVRPMVMGKGWEYEILFDTNNDLRRALGAATVPLTLIVKNNEILYRRLGYSPGAEDVLESKLKSLSRKSEN